MNTIKKKKMILEEARSGRLNLCKTIPAENRVNHHITILSKAADVRRDQLNQKRNISNSSTWMQNLPDLSGPLKRSLLYKMHRRRQQIVLRPPFASMVDDLQKQVKSKYDQLNTGFQRVSDEAIEAELTRAEQAFLLVSHPVAPDGESLSTVPSSSSWAEPGTYYVVD